MTTARTTFAEAGRRRLVPAGLALMLAVAGWALGSPAKPAHAFVVSQGECTFNASFNFGTAAISPTVTTIPYTLSGSGPCLSPEGPVGTLSLSGSGWLIGSCDAVATLNTLGDVVYVAISPGLGGYSTSMNLAGAGPAAAWTFQNNSFALEFTAAAVTAWSASEYTACTLGAPQNSMDVTGVMVFQDPSLG